MSRAAYKAHNLVQTEHQILNKYTNTNKQVLKAIDNIEHLTEMNANIQSKVKAIQTSKVQSLIQKRVNKQKVKAKKQGAKQLKKVPAKKIEAAETSKDVPVAEDKYIKRAEEKKPVFSLAEPEEVSSSIDLKNDDPSLPIVNMGLYNGVPYPAKLVQKYKKLDEENEKKQLLAKQQDRKQKELERKEEAAEQQN